jgi:hypothetical protein
LCLPLSCPFPCSSGSAATVGGCGGGTHSMRRARSFAAARSVGRNAEGATAVDACCRSARASVRARQSSPAARAAATPSLASARRRATSRGSVGRGAARRSLPLPQAGRKSTAARPTVNALARDRVLPHRMSTHRVPSEPRDCEAAPARVARSASYQLGIRRGEKRQTSGRDRATAMQPADRRHAAGRPSPG